MITYNAAISACEKAKQCDKAMELLEEMRQKGMEPDVITYSEAISACEKAKQAERASELFEEMKQKGLEADVVTDSAAMSACGAFELWQKVWGLLQHLRNGVAWVVGFGGMAYVVAADALFHTSPWSRATDRSVQQFPDGLGRGGISRVAPSGNSSWIRQWLASNLCCGMGRLDRLSHLVHTALGGEAGCVEACRGRAIIEEGVVKICRKISVSG